MATQEATRVKLGYQSAVRITALSAGSPIARFFGIRGGSLEIDADEHECGDTESGVRKRHKYGRTMLAATFDFYEKDELNIFDPPLSPTAGGFGLKTGQFVQIELWTQGLVSEFSFLALKPYTIPYFGLKNVRYTWNEDGKMEGTLTGKADGVWYYPSDVIPP